MRDPVKRLVLMEDRDRSVTMIRTLPLGVDKTPFAPSVFFAFSRARSRARLTARSQIPIPIETRSLPALTHVLPPTSTFRFAHLCRSRPRGSIRSLLPLQLLR